MNEKPKCDGECHMQEPYGFVPHAGCPLHDSMTEDERKKFTHFCEKCEWGDFPERCKPISKPEMPEWEAWFYRYVGLSEACKYRKDFIVEEIIKPAILQARAEGFTDGHNRAYFSSNGIDKPMGVSQWMEYGKKYGYEKFWENKIKTKGFDEGYMDGVTVAADAKRKWDEQARQEERARLIALAEGMKSEIGCFTSHDPAGNETPLGIRYRTLQDFITKAHSNKKSHE